MIVKPKDDGKSKTYLFDTGEEVTLWPYLEVWEYYHEKDNEYCNGIYVLNDNTVEDFDGVFWLPSAVIEAFKAYGYKVDL